MMIRFLTVLCLLICACGPTSDTSQQGSTRSRPSILLVTLDTTRADHLGFSHPEAETPHFDALAASGARFDAAYSTVPITLPAHTSIMTGLYPGDHRVHENARTVPSGLTLLAERFSARGYDTAAAVSAYPLARELGIARGFHQYDDRFGQASERDARATTDAAIQLMEGATDKPLLLWVHYFDPHDPYAPPEPFRTRFAQNPYLGEIAFMDQEFGRLLEAFRARIGDASHKILVVGDHGESLGEHGEAHHGNLLFQGAVHVPLIIAGADIEPERVVRPVSIRRVYQTLLGWIDEDTGPDLFQDDPEPILAEAMKPYLHYGWSPQVMAIDGNVKYIRSAQYHIFDLAEDPREEKNLAGDHEIPRAITAALSSYPLPGGEADPISREQQERLASLGYAASSGLSNREGPLPDPIAMSHLYPLLEEGAHQFGMGNYTAAIATYEKVLNQDPQNLMVLMRQAVAHSVEGRRTVAEDHFRRAGMLDPDSLDLHHYLGMHYLRFRDEAKAANQFRKVLDQWPEKLAALTALAGIQERSGRLGEALSLYRRAAQINDQDAFLHAKIGLLAMEQRNSASAAQAFHSAFELSPGSFRHHLEWGVVLLDLRRYKDAADQLDQVSEDHPGYPMALFKRAQAAVLLGESEPGIRIQRALEKAPPPLRRMIENEPLFRDFR